MFSPGTKRTNVSSRKERNLGHTLLHAPDSPLTPLVENRKSVNDSLIPNRPTSGTPAPWAPRLSVLARIPSPNKPDKSDEIDPIKPVFVGEFPQVVRDEQNSFPRKRHPGDACVFGGMDKGTCLSGFICGNRLFIWSYLTSVASRKCTVLELPPNTLGGGDISDNSYHSKNWLLGVVNWDTSSRRLSKVDQSCNSAGVVMCHQKSRAVIYWPEIYGEGATAPFTSIASTDESEVASSPVNGKSIPNRHQQHSGSSCFNSLIASAVDTTQHACVALACTSDGQLWQFNCTLTGINCKMVYQDFMNPVPQNSDSAQLLGSKGYPRSLIWRFLHHPMGESSRQFFLLTHCELLCFSVQLNPDVGVTKVWSQEIVGTDGDLGIKKDLAGQKRIWPLDVQVDDLGKVITVLVATFCKDRVSSSNYTQYSLLTMQYKSGLVSLDVQERVLEKKAPIQVIIPKARVEDEDFLFSMRLRVGGKPPGSTIILSGDGTATVTHYYRNSTRLYQFDLPYDAGKVLDASVLPSTDDGEDGAWVLLTEKAGIWAIPEKAVVLGGVEPPERSLSRKGSSNEGSSKEEMRNLTFSANIAPRRASSDAWDAGDKQRAIMTGIARRTAQDEESEALLSHLFDDFVLSGNLDDSLKKLQNSGAFERDGETSVFARKSKSIIDTLAKHWTTTRGAEIVAMTVISTQLMDKQQKHQLFLQFLALSKCHEELCSRQRQSLQIILEHGEKLAGMIQLRELQNMVNQNRVSGLGSPYPGAGNQISGALWDLIQLVGERSRRNTILLMDRDNAEVFYSKVSDLEEIFYCLDKHLEYILNTEQQLAIQIQRACELSNSCVTIVQTAMQYRNEHQMWYPPPEGLTPWYCQSVVRNGAWSIASFMLQLLSETSGLDMSAKSNIYTNLEVLAEILLEAYTGAITAKVDRHEENKSLLDEFWSRRDILLDSLYQQVISFAEAGYQDVNEKVDEQNEDIHGKLSTRLLSIAKRHEGYKTMWRICCNVNDTVLLRNLMRDSMGPQGGFSYFVFNQLYEQRQFSELLRLGEEFQEELSIFLKQHHDLLWLHELFLHQFSLASETLHALALSQDEDSILIDEEDKNVENVNPKHTLPDRRRLLNLSKIAALAEKGVNFEAKVKRIEADLKILKLQEEISKVLPTNEVIEQQLLRPEQLIELCLDSGNPQLALYAFDVFAWTSSSFRKSHRSLLEDCWRSATDQDDWGQLNEASVAEGWTDEETLHHLKDTILFQASNKCYGPQTETNEEGFDAVLPLSHVNVGSPIKKDSNPSVEAILMQHNNFPDAGKLMLTAVMLGAVQNDDQTELGFSPME